MIPCGDGIVYIKTIQKWMNVICRYYTDIEASCFESVGNSEENSTGSG